MIAGLIALIGSLIGLLIFIFWLWMLIDAIRNPRLSSNERLLWILVVFFLNAIGALIYFFAGRKT